MFNVLHYVMPALFAYLIAVGLLLGGGYGALSWLAAPEPVKVAAKAKPKRPPPPHYDEANSEEVSQAASNSEEVSQAASVASSSDASPSSIGDNNQAAPASSEPPPSPRAGSGPAANAGGAQVQASEPARDQKNLSVNAEASPDEVKQGAESSPSDFTQEAKQPAPAASAVSPSNQRTAASVVPAVKPAKRSHARQAASHSQRFAERRAPAVMMTLRTIEFPDGRRVSQLIPYRSAEPVWAFEPGD
ncbi:MAG: hypothetical protein ACXWKP_21095 [Bradyrhizobium sp.]